ncbi:citrate/2-methylcitrate synthase [Demetria terragena]|uniref:citrate/2-methylcitrate synthase n=1 Tax=Demetria terragena TaxID=63959 RepID=UPI0003691268|nr:citrate/2-methylcitrate synthase [Demetria terragena]
MTDREQMSVSAAADLLGVRKETVYAYVSRGLLRRTYASGPDGRRVSRLDLRQVRELAAQTHRTRPGQWELSIDSSISELDARGRLSYRGQDAIALAEAMSYEEVAETLWQQVPSGSWHPDEARDGHWQRAQSAAPSEATPADRARIVLALLAAENTERSALDSARTAIIRCAQSLGPRPVSWQGDVATTVTKALSLTVPTASTTDLVRRALCLLADHELATSTVAARAAAGTGAALPIVLLTGAAALGGPRHGRASTIAEQTLSIWLNTGELNSAVGGFGHSVYADVDPRAEALLAATLASHPEMEGPIHALSLQVLRRDGLHPNIDLALATMTHATSLRPGAGEAIFLVARLAGFTAHAVEERDQPMRFRPRAIYTGIMQAADRRTERPDG